MKLYLGRRQELILMVATFRFLLNQIVDNIIKFKFIIF